MLVWQNTKGENWFSYADATRNKIFLIYPVHGPLSLRMSVLPILLVVLSAPRILIF